MTDVAVDHLTDWTAWAWVWASVALLVSLAGLILAGPVLQGGDWAQRVPVQVAGWILGLAFLGTAAILPGVAMRRFPEQWMSGVLVLVLLAVAGGFAWLAWQVRNPYRHGYDEDIISPWWFYVPAVCVGLGALLGGLADGVTRLAAGIPIAVGSLVLLVVVAGVALWAWANDR